MSSDLLINSAIGETRLAVFENEKPVEIRLFRDHTPTLVGAVYCGRVISLSSEFQAAFVDIGNGNTGFLPLTFLPKRPGKKPQDLTSLLHEGQKLIVQVTADAIGDKSVKLTCRIEIISSAVILHPFREGAFVSSRIKDPDRREELKIFGNSVDLKGMGITFRTEAENIPNEEIGKTAQYLIRHWIRAVENWDKKKVPYLLAQGPDNLLQILREYGCSKLGTIIIDHPAALTKAQGWAREFSPDLLPKLTRHQDSTPLFEYYGIEEEIDQLYEKRISLPSGAWITLEQTEAMVVVDVNMGNARLSKDPIKQKLTINFQAAKEVFRQIRLRGLSGLIVIDFINMSGQKNAGKSNVSNLLGVIDNLILEDPMQVQRSNLSAFGLLELARKGRHTSLNRQLLADPCHNATVASQALSLLRKSEINAKTKPGIALSVKTSIAVQKWLKDHPELLDQFTKRTGCPLNISGS